ncbi:MAG: site-specific integrase [Eubacteriales bacterium]|nr:site-specific integrase [Eubacteriales bacterium]
MQGSVRKRGTTWSYRIDFGKLDGKRKQIEKGGYKTKKEADKALADALYQINNFGEFVENQKITFSEVYDEFIATEAQATRAYATIKRYNSLYRNHYKEIFGGLFVYQISANKVNEFFNEKRLKYSDEYVKGLYKTLKVIISFAYKKKYVKKNIFDEVTAPPDPRHISDIRAYSREELRLMADRLKETNIKTSFYIALNTGLRESEVFGLRWQDIDFENKRIKVNKQLLFQDRKWCFCPLKTINAYRSVNITDSFCNYLKKLKSEQDESRRLYGDGYKRNFVTDRLERNKENLMEITDFVNVKINGEMLSTNSIKFMSRIFKDELHIDFKFHNLRHTYATINAENGISPRYVQEMLGHSKFEFTLKYYTHITDKMSALARDALENNVTFEEFN